MKLELVVQQQFFMVSTTETVMKLLSRNSTLHS